MSFDPPATSESLTQRARRHLPDADFVYVYEAATQAPWKLVVRKGTGHPYVQHCHEQDLFLACKMAATKLEIGVYP